ncbi:MAG: hypothetical protein HMLKMBBP_03125 [Planctomycetes bacterium]|nr:hypothetical protein [Planctomycetota bacterium]
MGRATADRPPRIYSYIVTHDSGYAPNPFHGYCTLACCKPAIRKAAKKGDWVVGITSATRGRPQRLVYAMRVDEVLTFARYWADGRFRAKRPVWAPRDQVTVASVGDNCYEPVRRGRPRQIPCRHSRRDGSPNGGTRRRDLSGKHVLVSWTYAYFGSKPRALPDGIPIPGIGHRVVDVDTRAARKVVESLEELPRGRHGRPQLFAENGVRCTRSRCG